jgi:hypothetical protein
MPPMNLMNLKVHESYIPQNFILAKVVSFFNLLKSKPFGTLKSYNQEVRRSQKHIVSPPKMTSPEKIQKKYQ